MRDYSGSMDYFQNQLKAKGIDKSRLDMSDYAGLTKAELQWIVDHPEQYMAPAIEDVFAELDKLGDFIVPDGLTNREKEDLLIKSFPLLTDAVCRNEIWLGAGMSIGIDDVYDCIKEIDLPLVEKCAFEIKSEWLEKHASRWGAWGCHDAYSKFTDELDKLGKVKLLLMCIYIGDREMLGEDDCKDLRIKKFKEYLA